MSERENVNCFGNYTLVRCECENVEEISAIILSREFTFNEFLAFFDPIWRFYLNNGFFIVSSCQLVQYVKFI